MNSQTYVTDPSIWERFYKNMVQNKFNPYKYRKHRKIQKGRGGLYGRFKGSYMIPVNPNAIDTEPNMTKNTIITPVEADAKRALAELNNGRTANFKFNQRRHANRNCSIGCWKRLH